MESPLSADVLATPDGHSYDMSLVAYAERRVHEIAYLTPAKAPELMSVFSKACFMLGHHLKSAYLASQRARKATLDRKAIVTIDIIPNRLKEKSLANNEDHRNAILQLDPEFSVCLDRETEHDAVLMYLKRKTEDMENALSNVRKIYSETEGIYRRRNPNIAAGAPDTFDDPAPLPDVPPDPQPTTNQVTTTYGRFKVGQPKY